VEEDKVIEGLKNVLNIESEEDSDYNPISEPIINDDLKQQMTNSASFKSGFEKASYFAGAFTAYINAGMDVIMAHELVNNECIAMNNLAMGKLQLEVAKYTYVSKESQEI
jgi:hypothetical protein